MREHTNRRRERTEEAKTIEQWNELQEDIRNRIEARRFEKLVRIGVVKPVDNIEAVLV